jgi:hypothetical protein
MLLKYNKKMELKETEQIDTEKNIIVISEWVRGGIGLIRRDSLPFNHPKSFYQALLRLGVIPEDYGYMKDIYTDNGDEICPLCLGEGIIE